MAITYEIQRSILNTILRKMLEKKGPIAIDAYLRKLGFIDKISSTYKNYLKKQGYIALLKRSILFGDIAKLTPLGKAFIEGGGYKIKAYVPKVEAEYPIVSEKICKVSKSLFLNNHYDDAVFKAFKQLEIEIKKKTGVKGEIGVSLMNKVFSSTIGKVKFSDDIGLQDGYMNLFKGAMGAIRNDNGHNEVSYSREEAIELLHYASFLMRKVENMHVTV
jgi:uncharacterized protein (TIGR02391 family)